MSERVADNPTVMTRAQEWYVSWTVDLLVYTVVINLFDEYVEGVDIGSFTISIFTAVLLKAGLVVLERLEDRVKHYFKAKENPWATALGAVVWFGILIGGKLLILEFVHLVFGDRVELGTFAQEIALILTMLFARRLMNWTFKKLGTVGEAS